MPTTRSSTAKASAQSQDGQSAATAQAGNPADKLQLLQDALDKERTSRMYCNGVSGDCCMHVDDFEEAKMIGFDQIKLMACLWMKYDRLHYKDLEALWSAVKVATKKDAFPVKIPQQMYQASCDGSLDNSRAMDCCTEILEYFVINEPRLDAAQRMELRLAVLSTVHHRAKDREMWARIHKVMRDNLEPATN